VALSWKNKPQGSAVSFLTLYCCIPSKHIKLNILCKGKLTKACGFGGLVKVHSKEL